MADFNFTRKEQDRIDEIIAADLEGLSADDVKLYARWTAAIAASKADLEARKEQFAENSRLKLELAEREAADAKFAFKEMYNAALNRLEAVNSSNG